MRHYQINSATDKRNMYFGVVLGLIAPLVVAFSFFKIGVTSGTPWAEFFGWLVKIDYASSLIAVSTLADLALFMGFAYSNKMNVARGLFMATIFWAFMVVVFKFIIQG